MIKIILFFLLFQSLYADNLTKVTLQLSWFDQFQFAGYYIAKEKGFYKEEGLDVEILPFKFGKDIPKLINNSEIDFAVGRETLILEKAIHKNIVALYALFQASPLILISTQESGIDTISDFKHKKIMATIDDASEVSLKSMLNANNINVKHLKFLKHTHDINDLVNKKTDIISAYISKSPYTLQKMDVKYNIFSPKKHGFDMYSDFLYTNNNLIENNSELVQKFKKASLKAWRYAYKNIEESAKLIFDNYNTQNLTLDELIYEGIELKKLSYFQTDELGQMNLNKVQRIYDLYNIMGLLPKEKMQINSFIYNKNNFFTSLSKVEKNFIKKNPILLVGESEKLKPIHFLNNIGLHDGIVHEYLNIISYKTGFHFISEVHDQNALLNKLENKEIDFLAVATDDNPELIYSKPYFNLHETTFKIIGSKVNSTPTIGFLEQLNNTQKIPYLKSKYPTSKIIQISNIKQAIQSLKDGSIDLLYSTEETVLPYIKDNYISNIEYASTNLQTNILPLSFSLHKDSIILQKILSKAINSITYEQHKAIQTKWIPILIKSKFDWSIFWEILALFIIIILLIIYKQISMHDINKKLQNLNNQLKDLSELDHLTKLYNRRYFEEYIQNVIFNNRRSSHDASIVMFDIDDFKKINDTYGHHIGDAVLSQLASSLKEFSRTSDIIARVGGEEFLILLQNTSLKGAQTHCESLRKMIENLIIVNDEHKISFTVSMGLTNFRKDDTLDKVLLRIDSALYSVKHSGKNKLLVV